uniref:General transcription factor IIH subunit 3 n=1 Tax=Romanomermis culicivorax TaxID=13658 RepID=A0A915J9J5_ROMCU
MQIDKLGNQQRRHLHRSGALQKDQNMIIPPTGWNKGPKAQRLNTKDVIMEIPSFVCVVIDCNPIWWGKLMDEHKDDRGILPKRIARSIASFFSSFKLMDSNNRLLVMGAKFKADKILYSDFDRESENSNSTILNNLQDFLFDDDSEVVDQLETKFSSSIAKCLCRSSKQPLLDWLPDLLACDITGGFYLKIDNPHGLLQNLICYFLPDPHQRPKLSIFMDKDVDYRPSCFCHHKLINVGWVCSVCLSVFCHFSPICATCQSVFKFLPALPKVTKKKKKVAEKK